MSTILTHNRIRSKDCGPRTLVYGDSGEITNTALLKQHVALQFKIYLAFLELLVATKAIVKT